METCSNPQPYNLLLTSSCKHQRSLLISSPPPLFSPQAAAITPSSSPLCLMQAPEKVLPHLLRIVHHGRPLLFPPTSSPSLCNKMESKHRYDSVLPLRSSYQRPNKPSVNAVAPNPCCSKVALPLSMSLCGVYLSPHPSLYFSLATQGNLNWWIAAQFIIIPKPKLVMRKGCRRCWFCTRHGEYAPPPLSPLWSYTNFPFIDLFDVPFGIVYLQGGIAAAIRFAAAPLIPKPEHVDNDVAILLCREHMGCNHGEVVPSFSLSLIILFVPNISPWSHLPIVDASDNQIITAISANVLLLRSWRPCWNHRWSSLAARSPSLCIFLLGAPYSSCLLKSSCITGFFLQRISRSPNDRQLLCRLWSSSSHRAPTWLLLSPWTSYWELLPCIYMFWCHSLQDMCHSSSMIDPWQFLLQKCVAVFMVSSDASCRNSVSHWPSLQSLNPLTMIFFIKLHMPMPNFVDSKSNTKVLQPFLCLLPQKPRSRTAAYWHAYSRCSNDPVTMSFNHSMFHISAHTSEKFCVNRIQYKRDIIFLVLAVPAVLQSRCSRLVSAFPKIRYSICQIILLTCVSWTHTYLCKLACP